MAYDEKDPYSSVPSSRRSFIKKMVAAAFVAPVVSSFGLDALASAAPRHPTQRLPNQEPPDHEHDTGNDPGDPGHPDHPPHTHHT
jgi:hypothetical protein